MQIYKIGYCVHCGKQAKVTDTKGRPIRGLPGSKDVWLKLSYADGHTPTRIGTMCLCADCKPSDVSCETLCDKLIAENGSGISGSEHEFALCNSMSIEVVKE